MMAANNGNVTRATPHSKGPHSENDKGDLTINSMMFMLLRAQAPLG